MGGSLQKFVAGVLVCLIPAGPGFASSGSGLLHAAKGATVNGAEIKGPEAIFPGDKVSTYGQNSASLTFPGSAIVLAPYSEFVAQDGHFELNSGNTTVATSNGTWATLRKFKVIPVDQTNLVHYEITYYRHSALVYARDGDVRVEGDCRAWLVRSGRVGVIRDPQDCLAGVYLLPEPITNIDALLLGAGAVASGIGAAFLLYDSDMSPLRPDQSH